MSQPATYPTKQKRKPLAVQPDNPGEAASGDGTPSFKSATALFAWRPGQVGAGGAS